jgi:hypothetical protein
MNGFIFSRVRCGNSATSSPITSASRGVSWRVACFGFYLAENKYFFYSDGAYLCHLRYFRHEGPKGGVLRFERLKTQPLFPQVSSYYSYF